MSLLTFTNLSKEFNGSFIFTGISGQIREKSRIGIVGPNGTGKTTLLNILTGNTEQTSGVVQKSKNLQIGYIKQEAINSFSSFDNTIFEEMLSCFSDLILMEKQLQILEEEMAITDDMEAIFEKYGKMQSNYEESGGYELRLNIEKVLYGLDLKNKDMPLSHCSGGQLSRISLAKLLVMEPDLLILDEPTNHLDYKTMEWLEGYLSNWRKSVIIISHNRYFLEKTVNRIWDLTKVGLEEFVGNYSYYMKERVDRWNKREEKYNEQIKSFLNEIDFLRKNSNKNPVRAMERKKNLQIKVEIAKFGRNFITHTWSTSTIEKHIRSLKFLHPHIKDMNMKINQTEKIPQKIINRCKITVGFPDNPLFKAENLEINSRDRICLIGDNGCGKTTLIKTLLGTVKEIDGRIKLMDNIKIAYFSQGIKIENPENTVLQELIEYSPALSEQEARNYLAGYLFTGKDAFKKVRQLSGGERGRLTLAKLSVNKVNFLILDEPTNHLDIQTQEILEEALKNFKGAILMISHDRYLINKFANRIWEIENRELIKYPGDYSYYLNKKAI